MKSIVLCLVISLIVCLTKASTGPSLVAQKNGRINKSTTKKLISIRGGSSDDLSSIDWRYFLAGGICAATSHGITTPIGKG